ncbi:MAG: lysophospholipid acyltransferase family protein [Balneolaceae bacterium]|nr:lysophospholipid acyltransferase family protein [Balneolaceae bacterium]
MPDSENPIFIPASESAGFIAVFDIYVRNLFRRRFKNILIDQEYQPSAESRTIYYLNHTSWWDGLIPLLLNQKRFKQKARAMMEDKQMLEHRFFRKIGAFSVNLQDPRAAVKSLRYAKESMDRLNSCLFIYPEGKIVPFSTDKPEFKKGLGWLAKRCPQCDLVPIGIYIHTANSDKPDLCIRVGVPSRPDLNQKPADISHSLEEDLQTVLSTLQNDAHNQNEIFENL